MSRSFVGSSKTNRLAGCAISRASSNRAFSPPDIARTGADIAGVVSFHGIFDPPDNTGTNRIAAKVLALHGWQDPLATPEQVVSLAAELTAMGADWQIHAYGNTLHAFTNPAACDTKAGTVYNESANRRSWTAMQNFFAELFGD